MKALTALVFFGFLSSLNAFAEGQDITVNFTQVNTKAGNIVYALYADETDYDNSDSEYQMSRTPATPGDMTVILHNVAPGFYALTAFHDVNDDGILNTGLFGRPTEQFAISNITRTLWSHPTWAEVNFEVVAGQDTTVPMLMKMQ